MNDQNNFADEQADKQRRTQTLQEDAAPDPVGVYERPQRSAMSPTMMVILGILLLLIAAVVVYVFVF